MAALSALLEILREKIDERFHQVQADRKV